jgi:hypothetical protein
MIWLIVTISINGGPPQVSEKIPYPDMQSCQAEKAARDHRQDFFGFANNVRRHCGPCRVIVPALCC